MCALLVTGCGRIGFDLLGADGDGDGGGVDGVLLDGDLGPLPDRGPGVAASTWIDVVGWDGSVVAMTQRANGNLLVAGPCDVSVAAKACVAELDPGGALVWQQGIEAFTVFDIAVTPGGGFAIIGTGGFALFDAGRNITLRKNLSSPDESLVIRAGTVTLDGDLVLVGGYTGTGTRNRRLAWASRVSATTGEALWSTRRGAGSNYHTDINDVALIPDGHLAATGCTGGASTSTTFVAKLDVATGHPIWQASQTNPVSRDCPQSIAAANDGSVVVTTNVGIFRLDSQGALLWSTNVPLVGAGSAVGMTFDGDVIVAGTHSSGARAVLMLEGDGSALRWQNLVSPTGAQPGTFAAVLELDNDHVLAAGDEAWIARLTADGEMESVCGAVQANVDALVAKTFTMSLTGAGTWSTPAVDVLDPAVVPYDPAAAVSTECP